DLEGAILQRPPQRPSTAIEPVGGPPIDPAEDRPDADEIGRRRNVNPHQLQRQLRGDLDNIVLMALRKDPARRYSSVEQMAEDLRRYQDGLPVVARPSSLGYRSRKFVGRNKLAVGTAALIVLLVLGFGVAMAFQTAQITRERDLARAAIERGSELASRLAILAESQEEALDELEQERALRLEAEAERLALAGQSEEAESLRREVETTKSELLERAQALDALRDALDDKDSAAAAQPTEAPPNSLLESRLQAAEQQRQAEAARALEAETRQATLEHQLQEAQDQISSLERPAPETSSGPPPCQAGEEVVDQAIAFVRICTGTFTMGSAEDDTQAIDLEKPAHSVTLSEFWLGKYEVTNEQYRRWRPDHPGEADLPATGVSWSRARRFCQQYGFDLPTEAEWEFAARAGSQTLWAFGNDEGELGRFAWYAANSTGSPQPVGRKEPNRWGLYDMHGNVWEWIGGLRGPYSAGPKVDPKGLTPALARSRRQGPRSITSEDDAADLWVVRGGSYDAPPTDLRVAARGGSRPSARSPEIGFRCVRRITSE
ncbi:MAG: SUMF1/EgtB/PvdO family nonheme iron enzyme, partial [Acidobacteriota bacterium]